MLPYRATGSFSLRDDALASAKVGVALRSQFHQAIRGRGADMLDISVMRPLQQQLQTAEAGHKSIFEK